MYIHTYIHTINIYTYVHKYLHTCPSAHATNSSVLLSLKHVLTDACIYNTYKYLCIHTYIDTNIHVPLQTQPAAACSCLCDTRWHGWRTYMYIHTYIYTWIYAYIQLRTKYIHSTLTTSKHPSAIVCTCIYIYRST